MTSQTQAPAPAPTSAAATANADQQSAIEALTAWQRDPATRGTFAILSGPAGTGKTFCLRQLLAAGWEKERVVFTAPTNKAVRVIRQTITHAQYRPDCRTIFSLLGLRLEPSGEIKVLSAPEEPIDLSAVTLVVVDEASMISTKLLQHMQEAAESFQLRFLLLGDDYQLPPVKEAISPAWKLQFAVSCKLSQVMRHDNQILEQATMIRRGLDKPIPVTKFLDSHDVTGVEGVWDVSGPAGKAMLERAVDDGQFHRARGEGAKAIAWRNVTVDQINAWVRKRYWPGESVKPWLPGDRVIFTAPARSLEDKPLAATDDEGEVLTVQEGWHPAYPTFKIYNIAIRLDDNQQVTARVLRQDSFGEFAREVEDRASIARASPRMWKSFWAFKDSFHQLRHAYAITAHRAQGSTYEQVFVSWQDILRNPDRREAFRCLYVAATRPTKRLIWLKGG